MGSQTWHEELCVKEYDFFQLVRVLKLLGVNDNVIKYQSLPTLSFATSDVNHLKKNHEKYDLFITFMGLVGQAGVLPNHFTELMLERLDAKDNGLKAFLNIFEDRIINLFYQSWEQSRFYLALEQGEDTRAQRIINLIHSLTGQPIAIESETDKNIRLFYSGLYTKKNRPKGALEVLLSDYFLLPVKVIENQGRWFSLETEDVTKISRKKQNNYLGVNAVVGHRVWYIQNQFKIQVNADSYEVFKKLLPNRPMLKKLRSMVSEYIGMEFQFVLEVLVNKKTIPLTKISKKNHAQLGWNSWLNKGNNKMTKNKIIFSDNGYDLYTGIKKSPQLIS